MTSNLTPGEDSAQTPSNSSRSLKLSIIGLNLHHHLYRLASRASLEWVLTEVLDFADKEFCAQ
jgi:hypothetical protein